MSVCRSTQLVWVRSSQFQLGWETIDLVKLQVSMHSKSEEAQFQSQVCQISHSQFPFQFSVLVWYNQNRTSDSIMPSKRVTDQCWYALWFINPNVHLKTRQSHLL
jgi:hypothetical protein